MKFIRAWLIIKYRQFMNRCLLCNRDNNSWFHIGNPDLCDFCNKALRDAAEKAKFNFVAYIDPEEILRVIK